METVKEKIAYLRGMIEGGDVVKDETSKGIFGKILEILDEISEDVDDLFVAQEEMEEYVEAVDADLTELEEELYDEDDDSCSCHDHDHDEDDELVELECPVCQEPVYVEEEFLYDDNVEITCPDCGTVVFEGEDLDDELFTEDDEDN